MTNSSRCCPSSLMGLGAAASLWLVCSAPASAQDSPTASQPVRQPSSQPISQPVSQPTEAPLPLDFNEQFLIRGPDSPRVDLSRFGLGNPVLPGNYRADIYLNGLWLMRSDVLMKLDAAGLQAYACLAKGVVNRLGIDADALSPLAQRWMGQKPVGGIPAPEVLQEAIPACLSLEQIIAGGASQFAVSEQRLDLSVPQALLSKRPRGFVDPESWDYGVNAALLNYRFTNYQSTGGGGNASLSFLGLNAGINLEGWQLRHDGNLVSSNGSGSQYNSINTYLRHDVVELQSAFVLGDAYTDGQLFDSYGLRGVTLASDDRMLPDSRRGFAPTVRGQAFSQANVQIRQNGILLYETTVAPGPFVINDLYPTGFGGDLEVTVIESDGSRRVSLVAYSSLPQLLRDGGYRYSLSAGQYRQSTGVHEIAQAQLQYGLNNTLTLQGGMLATKEYQAYVLGGVVNTQLGAMSLDYTQARFGPAGLQARNGDGWRASLAKFVESTGTHFNASALHYSSDSFYTLQNAINTLDQMAAGSVNVVSNSRVQDSFKLSVNQNMGSWGALYMSGTRTIYASSQGQTSSYQVGYARQFGSVLVSIGVSRQTASAFQAENAQTFVNLIIPLEVRVNRSSSLNLIQQSDDMRGDSTQANLWGNAGDNYEYDYALFTTHAAAGNSAGGKLSYRSHYGQFGVGLSDGSGTTTTTLTADGALILHAGGITASNTLGETVGLVRVEDGEGTSVQGNQGAPVDANGYAVVRYLVPYYLNAVVLDLSSASLDTQLSSTEQVVAPHSGAVVLLNFDAVAGHTILIAGRLPSGAPLPFGAEVMDEQSQPIGAVGQGGRLEARVTQSSGRLTVKWGELAEQHCVLDYLIPVASDHRHAIVQLQGVCLPVSATAPASPPSPITPTVQGGYSTDLSLLDRDD